VPDCPAKTRGLAASSGPATELHLHYCGLDYHPIWPKVPPVPCAAVGRYGILSGPLG
jgi:hypothetical protein